jgi:hypothetical protein
MQSEGYELTEEQTSVSEFWPFSGSTRSFYLFESSDGWVGVLDCDMILSSDTAGQLSAALDTYAISFHVNDSDSWHYFLSHRGEPLDEFMSRSAEEFDLFGTAADDLTSLLGESGLEDFRMAIRELEGEFPPPSEEPPSNEAGLKIFSPSESNDANDAGAADDASNAVDDDEQSGNEPFDFFDHLSALKPLLRPNVTEQQVLKSLSATAIFAEETLAAFMPLIGINPFFAYSDFRDMAEDITPEELQMESVHLHRRLDFEQP